MLSLIAGPSSRIFFLRDPLHDYKIVALTTASSALCIAAGQIRNRTHISTTESKTYSNKITLRAGSADWQPTEPIIVAWKGWKISAV
jgi:hypothetical protein